MTSARMSQPWWACSSLRVMAGSSRITVPWVQLISSFRSRQALTVDAPSIASSMPIIRPRTRISRIRSHCCCSAESRCLEDLAQAPGGRQQILLFDHLDGGDARTGSDGIAAEGGGVHAGPQAGRNLRRGEHGRPGDAAAEGLGKRHDVGRHAGRLVGEPVARAAEAALHLVEDQQQYRVRRPVCASRPGNPRAESAPRLRPGSARS